jgi:cation:H+ antiporter
MALSLGYLPQLQNWIMYGLLPLVVLYVLISLVRDWRKRQV